MPRLKKTGSSGAAAKSDLNALQRLVVQCLTTELENGLKLGECNPATVRNALSLLRDNDVQSVDEYESEFDRIAQLLPQINPVEVTRVCSRYE